jgi:hypothetical protein
MPSLGPPGADLNEFDELRALDPVEMIHAGWSGSSRVLIVSDELRSWVVAVVADQPELGHRWIEAVDEAYGKRDDEALHPLGIELERVLCRIAQGEPWRIPANRLPTTAELVQHRREHPDAWAPVSEFVATERALAQRPLGDRRPLRRARARGRRPRTRAGRSSARSGDSGSDESDGSDGQPERSPTRSLASIARTLLVAMRGQL